MNNVEINYSATEKEALTIIYAIKNLDIIYLEIFLQFLLIIKLTFQSTNLRCIRVVTIVEVFLVGIYNLFIWLCCYFQLHPWILCFHSACNLL
jgi:hypothetical protein